ncbi:interleukin-1 receptor type 2 [Corythoichthys intestinalis]|uniref:interleukin-1 receptor type 2 n=1 Tax=Corythoichthys intestinalis TaxID=161448 RepID=UPI0025A5C5CF|nr:interleukin-1 receptor type 2 [Corythoichthys intestinalis]XP_057707672.1 interleukin-1 receptor type 2 [Corythoichthys intestinalis]XP_057707673.1 interleukin-1 receptor type 2 [Corythoichthys intestinalis]XP_061799513.1 interleukin-1 receptor type 2-like [Nerophis lumbriciformis]
MWAIFAPLMLTIALAVALAHGQILQLPPMPVKDGCFLAESELDLFRLENEAVEVSFPFFRTALKRRLVNPPDDAYRIVKGDGDDSKDGEGRIKRLGSNLWLLPARPSDSGNYTCTFRNTTYCVRGTVSLHVYAAASVDVDKLSYLYDATVGEDVTLRCPAGNLVSRTSIEWFKENLGSSLQSNRWQTLGHDAAKLHIPAVAHSDGGLYTCRLKVLVERRAFTLTRTIRLLVIGPEQHTSAEPNLSTALTPAPPLIAWPPNGSVIEASHGSALEVTCVVFTGCDQSASTIVWWTASGFEVEASPHIRREGREASGCWVNATLVVRAMTDEEAGAELTCLAENRDGRRQVTVTLRLQDSSGTWLVFVCVSTSCFLVVVSVFLYILLVKPKLKKKRKADYFLTRNSSSF